MALQRVVNDFGPVAIAAFTATSRIEQVIHQPYQTLGNALSTYTGQNFGAKKYDRIRLGYRKSMLLMAVFTAVMVPIMQVFGKPITSIFVNDAEVIGRLVVPIALTMIAFIGLWGIWWSVGIVWFLSGFTAWLRYMWYNKKKIPSEKTGKCRCGAIIYGQ